MVTMYSLCFVRQNCHSTDRSTDATWCVEDVLHALMFWGRLVTSNGGRIHKHAIKRVVVGLIPLKLHPKRFWKKGNLMKIKGTILSDMFQVIYVLKMIYQVGKKQCSNSGRKRKWYCPPGKWFYGPTPLRSGISWASDPPTPPGISNSLRGGGLDIFWNHTILTKCKFKIAEYWLPSSFFVFFKDWDEVKVN